MIKFSWQLAARCAGWTATLICLITGCPAPDFSLTTFDGQEISLAGLWGKVLEFIQKFTLTYPNGPDAGTRISQAYHITGIGKPSQATDIRKWQIVWSYSTFSTPYIKFALADECHLPMTIHQGRRI